MTLRHLLLECSLPAQPTLILRRSKWEEGRTIQFRLVDKTPESLAKNCDFNVMDAIADDWQFVREAA